ncbi:hypothetical protein PsYK624_034540 [Phanerochaete sordida]|uniref:Uncharacterized protein n=1 Tax=Phanerochaete sordida TaxID=48140 RepID=A0A9P3L9K6_9APHY|nr:hypothetical protein PsYK624_034540 [Phanerochaete sordida]
MSGEEWQIDSEHSDSEKSNDSEQSGSEQSDFDEDDSRWVDKAEEQARYQERAPKQGRQMLNIRKEMEDILLSKTLWALHGAEADALTSRLSSVLDTWRDAKPGTGPQKPLCLLENVYPSETLRAGALTGSDAQKASFLAKLCAPRGFKLGLAHLRVYLFGPVVDVFGHRNPRRDGRVGFTVDDERIDVEHLVDMDGNLVLEKLELDEDSDEENVPAGDAWRLDDGPCDREQYEEVRVMYACSSFRTADSCTG